MSEDAMANRGGIQDAKNLEARMGGEPTGPLDTSVKMAHAFFVEMDRLGFTSREDMERELAALLDDAGRAIVIAARAGRRQCPHFKWIRDPTDCMYCTPRGAP